MSVTIRDIAKIAGVSHSTVSRSLNDSPLISDNTKNRIKKIAKEMNFEFNSSARSLSTKKTETIGIILPDFYEDYNNGLYISLLMKVIRTGLERINFDCISSNPRNHYSGENSIFRLIKQKKVDGLLLVNHLVADEEIDFLQQANLPFVFMHFIPRNKERYNYVYTDHIKGGYMATEHLIKQGRKNILCLSDPDYQFHERTVGYKKCLEAHNLPIRKELILVDKCSFDFGYNLIMNNRNLLKKIDAVFAQADMIAIGVIEALKDLRIRIPEDIAVIGYDDIEMDNYFRPRLSTIHQPREQHALLACSQLVHMINSGERDTLMQEITQPELIIRETCGAGK